MRPRRKNPEATLRETQEAAESPRRDRPPAIAGQLLFEVLEARYIHIGYLNVERVSQSDPLLGQTEGAHFAKRAPASLVRFKW